MKCFDFSSFNVHLKCYIYAKFKQYLSAFEFRAKNKSFQPCKIFKNFAKRSAITNIENKMLISMININLKIVSKSGKIWFKSNKN